MSFIARCVDGLVKRPFWPLGSLRNATKRAGGTVKNNGGSPGKRLGIKKFSGQYYRVPADNCSFL